MMFELITSCLMINSYINHRFSGDIVIILVAYTEISKFPVFLFRRIGVFPRGTNPSYSGFYVSIFLEAMDLSGYSRVVIENCEMMLINLKAPEKSISKGTLKRVVCYFEEGGGP